jgi:hypothetical protein
MRLSDWISILGFAAGPLLLTTVAAFLGQLYRTLMWPAVSRVRQPRFSPHGTETQRVSLKRVDAVRSALSGSEAAHVREDAFRVNAHVHLAHVFAAIVYATVVCSLLIVFTSITFRWNIRIAIGYASLTLPLLILMWAIRLPLSQRLLILLFYGAAGVLLLLLFTKPGHTWPIAFDVIKTCALIPLPGLLFLFIRRNQPFLNFLIAIGVYFAGSGLLLDLFRNSMTIGSRKTVMAEPWLILLGLAVIVLGGVGAWMLLQRRRTSLLVIAVVVGVVSAVVLDDIVQHELPLPAGFVCFIAVAVLQALIIWSMFKGLAWLSERRFLTIELIQIHLVWTCLTIYFVATTIVETLFYRNRIAVRVGVIVALALFIVTLHLLLIRIYRRRKPLTNKRLLLLRVFGRPNEREDLLDDLNDTWRRIGAIDLLAASDVASRTLESRMLEAFLLRRGDDQFLRSEADLNLRIEQRRSRIEGDARYPVDPFFCHESIWWTAFTKLAEKSDVVMMDVRGFTTRNEGCVRELTYLLQHPLRQVVLVGDSRTDLHALDEMTRAAGVKEDLAILDFGKRSNEERRALFELLLNAAFP